MLSNLQGWAAKMEWFAPWNAHLRPAVVFDLDTYIVGDPAPFLDLKPDRLWLIREFTNPRARGESGIFVAPDDEELCARIWEKAQKWDFTPGDGAMLRLFAHDLIPDVIDGILSYVAHKLESGYPDHARVICCHGWPKPPGTTGWALERWTSLSSR